MTNIYLQFYSLAQLPLTIVSKSKATLLISYAQVCRYLWQGDFTFHIDSDCKWFQSLRPHPFFVVEKMNAHQGYPTAELVTECHDMNELFLWSCIFQSRSKAMTEIFMQGMKGLHESTTDFTLEKTGRF